jgi:ParB family chromosome partitioning protein
MRRRGGLGRGLEALIPATPQDDARRDSDEQARHRPLTDLSQRLAAVETPAGPEASSGPTLYEAPLELLDPNPRQPRETFDEDSLRELTESIEAVGVLQPIVIRPQGDRFQIVMGERRVRAAKAAGLTAIPAVVRMTEDDQLLRDALLENIHRQDLNPLEEAAAYEQLLVDFDVTHEELATRLGRSRPAISNALRLLRLPPSVQRRIAAGTLSAGHARTIAGLQNPEQQERLADRIVAEGLTVRQAEELAQRIELGSATLEPVAPKPRSRPTLQAPGMRALEEQLADRLETRVKVQLGKRKGKVLIEFATLEDLQRICDAIGLEVGTSSSTRAPQPPAEIHEEIEPVSLPTAAGVTG